MVYSVIDFYLNVPTPDGFSLENVWNFSTKELENRHNYIQYLFPTYEKGVNPRAPILTKQEVLTIKNSPELKVRILNSFMIMLNFYGLEYDSKAKRIVTSPRFDERAKEWMTPNNHNYRRITRILTSLTILGLEYFALLFLLIMINLTIKNPSRITGKTRIIWKKFGERIITQSYISSS